MQRNTDWDNPLDVREYYRLYALSYRRRNPDKVKAWQAKSEARPEYKRRMAAYKSEWQRKNRDKCNGAYRRWAERHPELVRHRSKQQQYRRKGAPGSHTLEQWEALKAKYNYTCLHCHLPEPLIRLTEDHIIPIIAGGSNDISNIQPLCRRCNARKGTNDELKEIIRRYANQ